ncbi:MAG: sll0787 family AIR synthase-like protein [Pseudomonadota bacterium]
MSSAIDTLVAGLRSSRGLAGKRDIAAVVGRLGLNGDSLVPVGDDCAAIPDPGGQGWLLLAIEGFQPAFVERDPWFAGWCGVMVNLSDIHAMGGRPLAVVDALWSRGGSALDELLAGMRAAAAAYRVPIAGGHSNLSSSGEQLAVAVLGRASSLLTSFDARPGDLLIAAIDLRGAYRAPFLNWNCSTGVAPERLRADLELLPVLAEQGLCRAAKDISQAGVLGTAVMLLECSGCGAEIDVDRVPRPAGVDDADWLLATFPSFGFLLAVAPQQADTVLQRFRARDIGCAVIGRCDDTPSLRLRSGERSCVAWRFPEDLLTGCAPARCSRGLSSRARSATVEMRYA